MHMDAEELFGKAAEKVRDVLKENGPLPAFKISRLTGMPANDVSGALGWLAHQGKIEVLDDDKGIFFKIVE
jgi:predicted transcriptional regulator